jgi:hypothetical protein
MESTNGIWNGVNILKSFTHNLVYYVFFFSLRELRDAAGKIIDAQIDFHGFWGGGEATTIETCRC